MRIYECPALHTRACMQQIRLFLYRRHPPLQRLFPLSDPSTQLFAHSWIESIGRFDVCVHIALRLSQRLAIFSYMILYNRPGAEELPDGVDGAWWWKGEESGFEFSLEYEDLVFDS